MDCTFSDVVATWTLDSSSTPINDDGTPNGTVSASATGYFCENCGNGFADIAGCLAHIIKRDVPLNAVDDALDAAQDIS